jgi:hypothetical protein
MDGFLMEWQLFPEGTIPEYTTPEWYAGRERAPHLEQEPHKWRLETAARFAVEKVIERGAAVVDLGAGDGGLLSLVRDRLIGLGWSARFCYGYDLQESNVAGALERGVPVGLLDVVSDFDRIKWPVGPVTAVCTEMLEHLVDPYGFLAKVARHADYLVASSPVTETGRDHYEFHTWAWDFEGYEALLERSGFAVLKHERWGMFQVLLAERTA